MNGRTLCLVFFLTSPAAASGGVELTALPDDVRHVRGEFLVDASTQAAWNVLSDYDGVSGFVSSVKESRVASRDAEGILLNQVILGRAGIFSKRVKVLLHLREDPAAGRIAFEDVGRWNFSVYRGGWEVAPAPAGARVTYTLEARPSFFAPDMVANGLFQKQARLLLAEIREEIERRGPAGKPAEPPPAPVAFAEDLGPAEIDVTGYPERMQRIYRENFLKNCAACHSPARALNAPHLELPPAALERFTRDHPAWVSDPRVLSAGVDPWKTYVKKMQRRPPCCGACPLLSFQDSKEIWEFLVYDSRQRKTGVNAERWQRERRALLRRFADAYPDQYERLYNKRSP